jgi:hypothetical protein
LAEVRRNIQHTNLDGAKILISWTENREIHERLAREQQISTGLSPPPKLTETNIFSEEEEDNKRDVGNTDDKRLQNDKSADIVVSPCIVLCSCVSTT